MLLMAIIISASASLPAASAPTEARSSRSEAVAGSHRASKNEPPSKRGSLVYSTATVARYNPVALLLDLRLGYQQPLSISPNPLLSQTYVSAKLMITTSPAVTLIGPVLEIAPLSVLKLSIAYAAVFFHGLFDSVQSFTDVAAEHGPAALRAVETRRYATTGDQLTFGLTLQGKLGPLGARSALQAIYMDVRLRPGDQAFYNQMTDIMHPNRGWVLMNDSDLVWISEFGLIAGARYSLVHAVYAGDPALADRNRHQRLGPMLAYQFRQEMGAAFRKPTIVLVTQWFIEHRYRAGQEVARAVPEVLLLFTFDGELWR